MHESGGPKLKLLIYVSIGYYPPPLPSLKFRSVLLIAWLPKDPLYFSFPLFLCSISCPTAFCCKY